MVCLIVSFPKINRHESLSQRVGLVNKTSVDLPLLMGYLGLSGMGGRTVKCSLGGVSILPVTTILRINFEIPPTEGYFFFSFYYQSYNSSNLILRILKSILII